MTEEQHRREAEWQTKFVKIFKTVYKNEKRSTESVYYRSVYPLIKYIMKTSYWNVDKKASREPVKRQATVVSMFVPPTQKP